MSQPEYNPSRVPPSVHVESDMGEPQVVTIEGHPGRFAIRLCRSATIYCSTEQWVGIDNAVRFGMQAAAEKAIADLDSPAVAS